MPDKNIFAMRGNVLSEACRAAYLEKPKIIPAIIEDGAVFENILTGDDFDVTKFPELSATIASSDPLAVGAKRIMQCAGSPVSRPPGSCPMRCAERRMECRCG
jgi:hypothetical protein